MGLVSHKAGCLSQDFLDVLYVFAMVRVPDACTIFHFGPYDGLGGSFFEDTCALYTIRSRAPGWLQQ